MAADVVDFLETIQVDYDQRKAGAALIGARDFLGQALLETGPVGQAGEGIVQGHVAQLAEAVVARLVVDQVAGQACADDQQADDGDSQRQGLHGRRIGIGGRHLQSVDMEGRHAGEVQADDRQDQYGDGDIFVAGQRAGGKGHGNGRQDDRQHDRYGQIELVPRHQAFDAIGQHTGIVHGRDSQADDAATQRRGASRAAAGGQDETRGGAADRDQQRQNGQDGIKRDRRRGAIGQDADEMSAPDRRAGRHGGQEVPADALRAAGCPGALEQAQDRPGAGNADDGCDEDKPDIVLSDDTFEDTDHGGKSRKRLHYVRPGGLQHVKITATGFRAR